MLAVRTQALFGSKKLQRKSIGMENGGKECKVSVWNKGSPGSFPMEYCTWMLISKETKKSTQVSWFLFLPRVSPRQLTCRRWIAMFFYSFLSQSRSLVARMFKFKKKLVARMQNTLAIDVCGCMFFFLLSDQPNEDSCVFGSYVPNACFKTFLYFFNPLFYQFIPISFLCFFPITVFSISSFQTGPQNYFLIVSNLKQNQAIKKYKTKISWR